MRKFILAVLIVLSVTMGFDALALAPVTASPWTTTTNPATARAGLVVYSTGEVDSKITAATNGLVTSAITNGLATTNYVNSITNGLATTNYVNSITNGLATTNYAKSVTNNFTALVYTNPSSILYTSSLPALTNGFVTSSITNGLATTNYVNSATQGLTNGLATTNYVNSITNGLATTNYVNAATNGFVTSSVTNGLATTNYVNAATNGLATSSITNGLATTNYVNATTNGLVTSSITNGLATTNYVNSATQGLTNGLATTNYVNSITNGLATTNYVNAATNGFVTAAITNGLATTNYVLTQISATNAANLTITTNLVIASTNNFTTLVYSNPAVFLYTNALPGLTNGFVTSSITNGLATTNYVNAATNGFVTSSITNGLATTNYVNAATNGLVTSSITNGLATTNYVNAATNGLVTSSVTNGLATTNFVLTQISATNTANLTVTTNLVVAATNNFTTLVYSNPVVFLYTNALPGLTNGFVTSSITNGLATTNYANSLTNNFTSLVYTNPSSILYTSSLPGLTNGFVTASVTNGLATTNYVNAATNGLVTSSITNGLATTNYVNTSIANKTNFDNLTVTNYSQFQTNAYFAGNTYTTNHAYDASGNLLDPEANEYVTASFVRNVLNNGVFLYGTTNTIAVGFSNILTSSTNKISLQFGANAPAGYTKGFTNFVTGTYPNGPYFASIVSTNTYQSVTGPFVNDFYIQADGSGAGHALGITPDIFVTYDLTNLIPICAGAEQSLTMAATTNLYTWIQAAAQYNSTNVAGFYIVRRVRVTSQNGNNLYINVKGGSGTVTTLAFNTPVTVNANYSGTFTGNGSGLTNMTLSGITNVGTAAYSNATAFRVIGNTNFPGIYVTNSLVLGDFKMDGSADTINFRRGNNSYPSIAQLYYDGDNNRIGGSVLDGFAGDFLYVPDGAPYLYVVDSYNSVQAIQAATLQLFGTGHAINAAAGAPYPLDVYAEGIGGQFGAYATVARFGGYSAANVFIDATAGVGNAASLVIAAWDQGETAAYGYYLGTDNNGNFRFSQMPSIDQAGYTSAKDFSGGLTGSLTLDKTGKIGIGTVTPAYMFDVNGSGHFVGAVKFDANITGALTNLAIYNSTNYNEVLTNSTIIGSTITNTTYYGNGVGLTNITGVSTNFATTSNPTNAYAAGILYTNLTGKKALLIGSFVQTGASASLIINYTNGGIGYRLPISVAASAAVNMPFSVPLSPNATFNCTAAVGYLTNTVLWSY